MADRLSNSPIITDSQGEQTNPGTSTVMADSGALTPGGIYEAIITVSASAAAKFTVQRRNSGNTATVGDAVSFYCPANSAVSVVCPFEIENGERIRVMMLAALTGTAVANVSATRVA